MSSTFNQFNQGATAGALSKLEETLNTTLRGSASATFIDTDIAGRVALEGESLGVHERDTVQTSFDSIYSALVSLESQDLGKEIQGTSQAALAGAGAMIAAAGVNSVFRRDPSDIGTVPQGATVLHSYLGSYSRQRVATEAYDEKEIRQSVKASIKLNYRASRQNGFGEMLFPTVVLAPDQAGYHMHLEQVNVMREVVRNLSGKYSKYFDRVNLMKAAIDHTILDMNDTLVVPVYMSGVNEDVFVAPSELKLENVNVNGVSVETGALKFGKDFGLLEISQNEALIRAGALSETDALDSAISLDKLFVKVGTDIIRLDNLEYLTTANFVPAPQGDSRAMILNFETQNLPLNKLTVQHNGSPLSGDLAAIATNEYTVRLKVSVTGRTNLQDSGTMLNAGQLAVSAITDKDGNIVDLTSGAGQTVANAINGGSLLGYCLKARRTNSNQRSRGLMLDISSYSILYVVPLLGPIHTKRPLGIGEEYSQADLAHLITATRTFTSNEAVTALFKIDALLAQYAKARDMGSDLDSEYLGISRRLVTPFHESDTLDISKVIASLKSEDRPAQVQATLVNKIRDMVFRAWYVSGLGVAADLFFAGEAPAPIVKIACDPVVARYLQVQGDLRTIGGKFQVQIEASWDKRMKDKIFIAFGYDTADGETNYHALNFGMMLWKPEVVIAAPIYHQGQTSRQLMVQPSFLHVCNTPILMRLDVTNLEKAAVDTVAINVRNA